MEAMISGLQYTLSRLMMTSLPGISDVDKLVEEAKVYDFVRFLWCDIHGIQHVAHVSKYSMPSMIKHGVGVCQTQLALGPGGEDADYAGYPKGVPSTDGNCYMIPVPGTLHPVPWAGGGRHNIGQVLCESFWSDGTPQEAHPRLVARRQLQRLVDQGFTLKSAWEVEFTLNDAKTREPVPHDKDYFSMIAMQPFELDFLDLAGQLSSIGINIEKFNTEYFPGSFEVNLPPEFGIKATDDLFTFKGICKEYFKGKGLIVSFMPCPRGVPTCMLHLNHSLWGADGSNVFSDVTAVDGISQVARWWTAGLVKHARALTILLCPTANCYRLMHEPLLPNSANWGVDNRHMAFRLKNQSAAMTYIENRIPSSASNPYVVVAATIAAGLDGVLNKLELPPEGDPNAEPTPDNFPEAIEALEKDTELIQALGAEFVEWFLHSKKRVELKKFGGHDQRARNAEEIDKEMEEYFVNI